MRNWQLALTALILALGSASPAHAFDGRRGGFVLGGGAGVGTIVAKQELSAFGSSLESDWESEAAFVTDFLIGGGINDKTVLMYSSRVSWFSPGDVTLATGVGTFSANFYAEPIAPSPYLTMGLGFSGLDAPFEENADAAGGLGLRIGGGYELNPHWSIELGITYGNPESDEFDASLESKIWGVHVVFVGMAY